MNFRQSLTCGLVAAMMVLVPLWSYARSNDNTVAKRLEIIEKQLMAVQRKIFSSNFSQQQQTPEGGLSNTGENTRLADLETRLSQLESQIRQLTGRIEEGNYQLGRLKQQMETMTRDYEFRLASLEKARATPFPTAKSIIDEKAVAASARKAEKADILPAGTEKQQYSYAQKLVIKGQYQRAEAALDAFLKRYPKARLAGNAQYWLGQTFYVRKMYTKATRAFLEGYNNYPESPKAPAFLLKIGMSLHAMGEKKDSCDAYRELASRFPASTESKSKRPPEEKRAGCR